MHQIGPNQICGDSLGKRCEASCMIGVSMGQHYQLQVAHPVPAQAVDQRHRVRTSVDEGEPALPARDQQSITLADVESNDPGLGWLDSGSEECCRHRDRHYECDRAPGSTKRVECRANANS